MKCIYSSVNVANASIKMCDIDNSICVFQNTKLQNPKYCTKRKMQDKKNEHFKILEYRINELEDNQLLLRTAIKTLENKNQ